MGMMDISPGKQAILQDSIVLGRLPPELLQIIRVGDCPEFLDAIAAASLIPPLTLRFFAHFENIFADTCARWISGLRYESKSIIEGFARILRFAPHLSVYLKSYLQRTPKSTQVNGHILQDRMVPYLLLISQDDVTSLAESELQRLLLAALRLLTFDKQSYAISMSTSIIQTLLQHPSRSVRYLVVKILCCLLSASDAKLEEMIDMHIGRIDVVIGDFDELHIDYGFLELYEEKTRKDLEGMRCNSREITRSLAPFHLKSLSPLVTKYDDLLLARPNGPPSRPSSLIQTTTTSRNLRNFAHALISDSPILVHGLSGSGKTSLVNDFARELGNDSKMVTLHLNEQTDAKMLIGMYVADSTPGSFSWRPGILTTAIREGRWVFIEDLDRAPNEVISVILPLIERGEILIPSRAENIKAASDFRLIASIRTSLNMDGCEIAPAAQMLGAHLWQRVPLQVPNQEEFMEIIRGVHPILHKLLPGILAVYKRLYTLSQTPSFSSKNRSSVGRPTSPRDLMKWCRRLDAILVTAGSKTGEEPIKETTKDEMFMEAADCFASSLQTDDSRKSILYSLAEEMHIPAQRIEHYIDAYIPRYEEAESYVQIGRVKITKQKRLNRVYKTSPRSRPFANTSHAKRLLEQVAAALRMREPVLLVGETGIGKTTVIQQLADSLGHKLTAVNLSQQSEIGDLLGGYKPVNVRSLAIPLKEEFDDLFSSTGISESRNQKYLEQLGKSVAKGQWSKASKLWREAPRMFERMTLDLSKSENRTPKDSNEQPPKRRKVNSRLQNLLELKPRWDRFAESLDIFDAQLSGGSKGFAFTFVEGNIVKAVRNGDWVLLDEINLASPDTIESIADLLHDGSSGSPSILLSETGEIERVRAHPDFRIFAAMNPATDIGKKDLPIGLRSRFTEIYVGSPERDLSDLLSVIKAYLKGTSNSDERAAHDVARLYLNTKRLADEKRLVDGANQVPHYSLRTLTRVLGYAAEIAPSYGLRRALYEGYSMGFLTLLNGESERILIPLINHHLLESHSNPRSILSQAPRHPQDGRQYVRFMNQKKDRQYWMLQGRETPLEQSQYIITPFVERNLLNLVRATSTRKFPVLVQGPTSSGKTSMIEYLAKFSGNKFIRINNHEHTDLQEYLGSYVSGPDGQLRFQEGILVQALREGHWIVLDELNLAPSDVLEALNRLLDDNRELLIPETQEIVRPDQNFMLFATQNPPGLYGGRKTLSRAFRNRFLELHFDDIPEDELEYILEKRSQNVAPSDCKRIVMVYKELARLRQSTRLFEQKDSFATLRDLFRWASRDAENREQLAANGYMLLAERVRRPEDRVVVKEIIETVMKVELDPAILYNPDSCSEIQLYNKTLNRHGIVWNKAIRRIYALVAHALRNNEPVLLVGETGCGKTTVCQMLADAFKKDLHIVNAHQNTETGDLIGAQRPVRNRAAITKQLEEDLVAVLRTDDNKDTLDLSSLDSLSAAYHDISDEARASIPDHMIQRIEAGLLRSKSLFEWADGSLVQAMKEGQFYLLDEISLADDSVLERLNSVLESGRTLLLAEKGINNSFVQAADGFQFLATMNPGGDYGKRELSPALRNRFTEIWVPSLSDQEDILQIVEAKLSSRFKHFAKAMVEFAEWFGTLYRSSTIQSISVRDILAWTTFINTISVKSANFAVLHGAAMIYIDTLGANPAALLAIDPMTIIEERKKCLKKLSVLLDHDIVPVYNAPVFLQDTNLELKFGEFRISKLPCAGVVSEFAFEAPTTKTNAMRIVRALQVQKPILIEGNPGVGKTTLIVALARAVGKSLTRINLSEQTDLMDLFGSDAPVEGAEAGNFAWRDAPFLQAMQNGDWVLLDEMNLASQSVLEGLNACLDHRGTVYISELDQTFIRHPDFCVFAAQNPHHQGGGRKGLPSSFVNRFTVVYADVFRDDDLAIICKHSFPAITGNTLSRIISFVSILEKEVVHLRKFGSQGGPWEFNLRDSLRWLQLLTSTKPFLQASQLTDFLDILFRQRFRSTRDKEKVDIIIMQVFGSNVPLRNYFHSLSAHEYQVGMAYLPRHPLIRRLAPPVINAAKRLPELESIMMCVSQCIPCILVGPSGSGKTTLIQHIAAASGTDLVVFALNSDIDTVDLVGGYEQVDPQREISTFLKQLEVSIETRILMSLPILAPPEALEILSLCQSGQVKSTEFLSDLYVRLLALQSKTSIPEIKDFAAHCNIFMNQSTNVQTARFEWVDGVLIKALEEGKWLVLDNANLCSSSVLDRLNSLLEPNGFLSINEHCGPDGKPRLVKPHPNFRLFMTMDPRFGELSRAMRNRAVELYLDLDARCYTRANTGRYGIYDSNAFSERYKRLIDILQDSSHERQTELLAGVALDHLSRDDASALERFSGNTLNDLVGVKTVVSPLVFNRYMKIINSEVYGFLRESIQNGYSLLEKEMELSKSFRDAQSIHPLQNSPLVPLLKLYNGSDRTIWLGALMDFHLDILSAYDAYQSQAIAAGSLKPSHMNRLQRSMCRDRIPSVAKDSTAGVSMFLEDTLRNLQVYLQDKLSMYENITTEKRLVSTIMRIWWETYQLVCAIEFEDATFQAHLAIIQEILSKQSLSTTISINRSPNHSEVSSSQRSFRNIVKIMQESTKTYFESGFKLTTGLSMERLWLIFRPRIISSRQKLQALIDMKELATRFDHLRWKVPILVSELSSIIPSLLEAYSLILTSEVDGMSLIKALRSEIFALEKQTTVEDPLLPLFSIQFEALVQYGIIGGVENTADELTVLGNIPTALLMDIESASNTSVYLQNICSLWGSKGNIHPIEDTFSTSLLNNLHEVSDVELSMLSLLEQELPILGKYISQRAAALCRSQLLDLNMHLLQLIIETTRVHNINLALKVEQLKLHLTSNTKGADYRDKILGFDDADQLQDPAKPLLYFERVFQKHLRPAIDAIVAARNKLENRMKHSSLAWIHFAIGCIILYVPDRPYDPNCRQLLQREQHIYAKNKLETKIDALAAYEKIFTGQDKNFRIQSLEKDLLGLGESAEPIEKVFRPEKSELNELQGEFGSLLNVVIRADPLNMVSSQLDSADKKTAEYIEVLIGNVAQIKQRLLERFRGYEDITVPAAGMLQCLLSGLYMAGLASTPTSPNNTTISKISSVTPFLGGGPERKDLSLLEEPLDILAIVGMNGRVEGLDSFDDDQRELFLSTIHTCYTNWSKKLKIDRTEAESKSGLYRFRGSAENEEEHDEDEFNELFPSFGEDSVPSAQDLAKDYSSRHMAIQIANLQHKVLLREISPEKSIVSVLRQMSERIGTIYNPCTPFLSGAMTRNLLPGVLLKVNDHIDALKSSSTVPDSYNFYTDMNLPEARKLVLLIQQIQYRFQDLQNVDEIGHMQPLKDVMVSCKELLRIHHTEPLANLISKVEKVHAYIHEWQFGGWATRANSAITLYDKLTSTIISWRRLELATWAKLFDMEDKKCNDDAKFWWFIAYEVVVAVPLSIAQSEQELRSYATKLLQDLETYFMTAIQGQFAERLKLLDQLQRHLGVIMVEFPLVSIIQNAVTNFVRIYARYEKTVAENLHRGRLVLEKAMRDVILLASWKDTNIVALRDSAQRSHHKLFKIVRKYRRILGEPMGQVLMNGLPDGQEVLITDCAPQLPAILTSVDTYAISLCESQLPHWAEKSKRLVNVSKTVALMDKAAQIPSTALDVVQLLESFLNSLVSSMRELQEATPSVLTEDNKITIKHLKSRKRRLFADTLKELRQMGIKHNLGSAALSRQDSLSVILSNSETLHPVEFLSLDNIDYFFHKAIDVMPRARAARRQHSEDLSNTEIFRSTGVLEGLLQVLLKQRNSIAAAVLDSDKLSQTIQMVQALWAPGKYDITHSHDDSNHQPVLKWLPNILRVGSELVRILGLTAQVDVTKVLHFLLSNIQTFDDISQAWATLPALPAGIDSTAREDLRVQTDDAIGKLRNGLKSMGENTPQVCFILQQIHPWSAVNKITKSQISQDHDISFLDGKVSQICDSILVAIKKLKTSAEQLPNSTEVSAWLANSDQFLLERINCLHISEITTRINSALDVVKYIPFEDKYSGKIVGAIFAVALPIFQEYFSVVQESVIRYADLHRTTCKMTYILSKSFIKIASNGFCTPSEKSDAQEGKTENLEEGTGLGDGEGAEDISKSIQDDEDLSELAQEPDKGKDQGVEDEKDAVEMADSDMEGQLSEAQEKGDDEEGSGNDGSDEDGVEEEAGDVDDLDPSAVDEKMWDGDGDEAAKEQESDKSKGKKGDDEQAAAQDNNLENIEGEEQELGAEQDETAHQDEAEKHDPQAQEGETLEMPEEMELDGNGPDEHTSGSDDGMDDLSDGGDDGRDIGNLEDEEDQDMSEGDEIGMQDDHDARSDIDMMDPKNEEEQLGTDTQDAGEKAEEDSKSDGEVIEDVLRDHSDDAKIDLDNEVPNEVPSEVLGTSESQGENKADESASKGKAQREDGEESGEAAEQKETATKEAEKGEETIGEAQLSHNDETSSSTETKPFKKLGDTLERWYRQQSQIRDASEKLEQSKEQPMEVDSNKTEFQHLQDEEAQADTQALGTAAQEQAQALDESMAIDTDTTDMPEIFQPDEAETNSIENDESDDLAPVPQEEQNFGGEHEGRASVIIRQAKRENEGEKNQTRDQGEPGLEEDIEEVDMQLSTTHIDDQDISIVSRSANEARQLWTNYESLTRDLSLSLTEQLRLILAPTQATKMRGDFRTGKRLNIKRIIPYIASQYKRDKIWMRRSIPSKRSYQIMLAVDDSKSMGESGSGSLAFETLVMVSKSLSMLEVGEICIVGFGEDFKVAHDFETPFSNEAGSKAFQNFTFDQGRTDIAKLVRKSIEHFRTARAKKSSSSSDLWQLELIISDGVCDSSEHEPILRLLREAIEERIMMVFVIVDDVKNKKNGESVMDLKEAKFIKNEVTGVSNVKIERYLDTFPFQYYLIVSNVKELPGVLATLLRQWFAEVADSSG